MIALGIDIGGSGIKGAPVDALNGSLVEERYRVCTPDPSSPDAVAKTILEIKRHFNWSGPIGCGYPGIVRNGITLSAANVDKRWIGTNAQTVITRALEDQQSPVVVLNDADAAGIAEMRFGAGKDRKGVVMIITLGTGIGTALFIHGTLVPNLEIGHIEINGCEAEARLSETVRKKEDISWKKWGGRLNEYLEKIEALFSPDLIILGGGGSKKADKFMPYLAIKTEIVPATLLNEAGIIGAAMAAKEAFE